MRSALIVVSLLLLSCPPPKKPIEMPALTRCEVNLEATGLFAQVGTTARAKVIENASELIGGGQAHGQVGDYLLSNDRIRVVIQRPMRLISPLPYGGNIIDADLVRPAGEAGRDQFGKVETVYAFGRTLNVKQVEVLNDGANGGAAVIAATGEDAVVDYVNIPNVIQQFLSTGVQLVTDPNVPLPIKGTTYYVLSPGETRVRMLTAFCNSGKDPVVMQVGDLFDQGGVSEYFNATGCAKGMGNTGCLVDPMNWFGYQADGVAYGMRDYKFSDPKTPAVNAVMSVTGITAVLAEGEGQMGLLSWVDPMASRRPGSFGVLAGAQRNFVRDFFVGRDLAEISAGLLVLDAANRGRINVTVQNAAGAPLAGARVAVVAVTGDAMQTLGVTDAQGKVNIDVPPGDYMLSTGTPGHVIEAASPVTVANNGTVAVTLKEGATRAISVTVKDPFGQPLTARVVVQCTNQICANTTDSYKRFADLEKLPSNVQAVGYVPATGALTLQVPPGQYEVFVSRGPEYSAWPDTFPLHGQAVDLTTTDATLNATLAHVVDTTGWMSADLHVHAVNSADSSLANAVRVASFAAEGVDVLVSTDHDVITDYAPIIEQLGYQNAIGSMIGLESTPFDFGHQNVWPVTREDSPTGGAFDWAGGDGATLRLEQVYAGLRSKFPLALVQLNHPRSGFMGTLSSLQVDTETGASHANPATFRMEASPDATANDTRLFSPNFDAIESMNGLGASYAVLNDYMTFMSRGLVKTATAVSDSHTARTAVGGYGRTWVKVGGDTFSQFTNQAFVDAMKAHRAIGSNSPFVRMTAQALDANQQPTGPVKDIGDTLSLAAGAKYAVTVDVQMPEWMQFTSIELYTHASGRGSERGVANDSWPESRILQKKTYDPTALPVEAVPGLNGFNARRVHVTETFTLTASADTWVVAMVNSSSAARTLMPMAWESVSCSGGVCTGNTNRPQAFTNAILIDADGSGAYDNYPLKTGAPLKAVNPQPSVKPVRRVPSLDEMLDFLRRVNAHDHSPQSVKW